MSLNTYLNSERQGSIEISAAVSADAATLPELELVTCIFNIYTKCART